MTGLRDRKEKGHTEPEEGQRSEARRSCGKAGTTGLGLHVELENSTNHIWDGSAGDVLGLKSHFKSNGNKCIKRLEKKNGIHIIALQVP